MEFTIEELPEKSAKSISRMKKGRFRFLRNIVVSSILTMIRFLRLRTSSVRNLSQSLLSKPLKKRLSKSIIKREFLVFALIIIFVTSAVVGWDLWQSHQQQQALRQYQQTFREESRTLQTLRQQSQSFITAFQYEWIREVEGNSAPVLRLLRGVPQEIAIDIHFKSFQKSSNDSKFSIDGVASNFEKLFQLENYFKMNNWYASVTLLDDEGSMNRRPFQLKLVSLNTINMLFKD